MLTSPSHSTRTQCHCLNTIINYLLVSRCLPIFRPETQSYFTSRPRNHPSTVHKLRLLLCTSRYTIVRSSAGSIYSIPEISRYLVLRKHDISYFRYQFDRSLPSVFPVQKEKISKIITYIPTIKINVFCSRQIFMYHKIIIFSNT